MAIEFDGNLDRELDRILSKFSRLSYEDSWKYFRTVEAFAGTTKQMRFLKSRSDIEIYSCFEQGYRLPIMLQQQIAFAIWEMSQPKKN